MLSDKQNRNIRLAACIVTTGVAFFGTLRWQAPTTDAPSRVTPVTPVMHVKPSAAAKKEDGCLLAQRIGSLDRIPDDLKRAILKYAPCDGSGPSRM
jgi:hypothetical protein